MCQDKGFKFFLDTKNNKALPLDLACPKCLSVQSPASLPYVVATQFATEKQLEDLTHMPLNPMSQTI
jgi:hypothetical protein